MPTLREKILIGVSGTALATGMLVTFQPPSQQDLLHNQTQRQEKDVENLADSQQREHERYRQAGQAHAEAENIRRLTPGEYDPRPHPRVRIRLP